IWNFERHYGSLKLILEAHMKIAVGAVIQESNSFSPLPTTLDHFRGIFYLRRDEIPKRLRDSSTEVSGFYEVLGETNYEVVPTVAAMAVSGGPLNRKTYQELRDALLLPIASARPDGVLLALHGAMSTEDSDDGDSEILQELRSEVG